MKHRSGFTLTEMFVVIAVVVAVLPIIGTFFADGWVASHRALARVENNQLVPLLMKQWQSVIHNTASDQWSVDEKGFAAGTLRIYQENRHLVVDSGASRRTFLLPADAQCRFVIEEHSGLSDCAVLHVNWKSRYMQRENSKDFRFVACGGQE